MSNFRRGKTMTPADFMQTVAHEKTGERSSERSGNHNVKSGSKEYRWGHSSRSRTTQSKYKVPILDVTVPPSQVPVDFEKKLHSALFDWVSHSRTATRLTSLGVEGHDVRKILSMFEVYMDGELTRTELKPDGNTDPWSVFHLWNGDPSRYAQMVDRAFTLKLFDFVSELSPRSQVSPISIRAIQAARSALELRYPAEDYPEARNMKRKIILHVGPTNSGKTYNALRALADSRSGVYAGPLRLLAHEVWRRLNQGDIRPSDADPSSAPRYARMCNLITGEEHRMVSPYADLTSCTVEMLNLTKHYNVVVVDEIQMLTDPDRGGAWTAAVLGLRADEIHLCGEDAAVPLVQAMLDGTGDEVIVNRYNRLTPLSVSSESLKGNWNAVQPGDCVVAFSRTKVFNYKAKLEAVTGLRCAVVYGRLPPETRSEQAALFNTKGSGYDVLVATDAIGMGLNLKIKRVIFAETTKYDGTKEVNLSLSQLKQIGGRAGRFGEHEDGTNGIVTCITDNQLPIIQKAFEMQPPELRQATLPLGYQEFSRMAELLPKNYRMADLFTLLHLGAKIGKCYSLPSHESSFKGIKHIDSIGGSLSLKEKLLFCFCPIAWGKEAEIEVMKKFIHYYQTGLEVPINECLVGTYLLETLEKTLEAKKSLGHVGTDPIQNKGTLADLETLHRVLLAYIWLSYRIPVSFHKQDETLEIKERAETAIDFVLEGLAHESIQKNVVMKTTQLAQRAPGNNIDYELRLRRTSKFETKAAPVSVSA